jgi:hypothetical protein
MGVLPEPAGSETVRTLASCHAGQENATRMRALLIAAGALLLAAGLLWPVVSRYAGRLPGDIVVRRPGFTFVFPIVTCLILSLLLSLLVALLRR